MAEKKYLDEVGLQDVASHVNTRLKTVTSIPVSADNGAVRLYVGTTTATYIQGHIYQYDSVNSEWVDITSSGQFIQYSTMPTASVDIVNKIVQYIGATNQNYTNGYFYKCVLDNNAYIWQNIAVQSGSGGSDNIINGYFNSSDNLFYEESTYTTPITGASNVLYISLDTDFSYRYNGLIFVRVDNEIDDTTTASNKTWSSNKISSEIAPNGSTVTPTDVVATWLACAGLHQSYTTLNEVLADSAILSALMASTNAVDYLVRSTTWASTICSNELAMMYIGTNNYCADTLLADSTWKTAICNSTYFESVLNVKVPTMTSTTTPSGECIESSHYYIWGAWMAFSNRTESSIEWLSNGISNQYIGYKFNEPVEIYMVLNQNSLNSTLSQRNAKNCRIEYSNDGTNWTSLLSFVNPQTASNISKNILGTKVKAKYWRLYAENCYTTSSAYIGIAIHDLQFYGRSDYPIGTDDATDTNANISAIAYNEDGVTCKNPNGYKIGEHFYRNAKFCTAKAAIAQGEQFTLETNYVEGTVANSIGKYVVLASSSNASDTVANKLNTLKPAFNALSMEDKTRTELWIETYSNDALTSCQIYINLNTGGGLFEGCSNFSDTDYWKDIIFLNELKNYRYKFSTSGNMTVQDRASLTVSTVFKLVYR